MSPIVVFLAVFLSLGSLAAVLLLAADKPPPGEHASWRFRLLGFHSEVSGWAAYWLIRALLVAFIVLCLALLGICAYLLITGQPLPLLD